MINFKDLREFIKLFSYILWHGIYVVSESAATWTSMWGRLIRLGMLNGYKLVISFKVIADMQNCCCRWPCLWHLTSEMHSSLLKQAWQISCGAHICHYLQHLSQIIGWPSKHQCTICWRCAFSFLVDRIVVSNRTVVQLPWEIFQRKLIWSLQILWHVIPQGMPLGGAGSSLGTNAGWPSCAEPIASRIKHWANASSFIYFDMASLKGCLRRSRDHGSTNISQCVHLTW